MSMIEKTNEQVQQYCSDKNLISYIIYMVPRRPGVYLFSLLLENIFFPPGTKENEDFQFHIINWEEMVIGIITIPKKKEIYATEIMKVSGNRVADGIPMMITDGRVVSFPISGDNIFTLENEEGHPMYKGNNARDMMISIENQIISEIEDDSISEWYEKNKPF